MQNSGEDPLLRSARREALIALSTFVLALAYTVGYCTLHGYGQEPGGLTLVLGVPSWVMYGVILPWGVCTLFNCWFSLFYMKDHELEEAAVPPDAEGVTDEEESLRDE